MEDNRKITRLLRVAVKEASRPLLAQAGFEEDKGATASSHVRYFQGCRQFIVFQWEKYQTPRFMLKFGNVDPMSIEGRTVIYRVGYLQPRWSIGTSGWFRADRSFWSRAFGRSRTEHEVIEAVVTEMLTMWPEVVEWLDRNERGKHVYVFNEVLRFKPGCGPVG